jgi:hypothetical protein
MIGKTVARIQQGQVECGSEMTVHFTDGTALRIEGHSYEDVSLSQTPLSATDVRRLAREAQGRREQERVARLTAEVRRREFAAERERAEAELSPAEFQRWLMERDSLYILKQAWSSERLESQFYDTNPLLDRVYGEGGVLPISFSWQQDAQNAEEAR